VGGRRPRYHRPMKTALTGAAVNLSKLAQAEGILGIVILADEKGEAIEVISLAERQQQRAALGRALKLLTPKNTTN
jgi:hypothetical protein